MSPVGLLRRSKLFSTFLTQLGRLSHSAKSLKTCMDSDIVVAEKDWNIEQVSNLVTDNMKSQIEVDFSIAKNGRYGGVCKVLGLLKK